MCMVDDGERAEIWNSRKVAHGRKARKCDECGRQIATGEPYRNIWMLCEGDPSTWFTCQHCMSAQAWLEAQCGGFLCGGVLEDLKEHLDELAFEEPGSKVRLYRLIVGMQRQWKSLIEPARLMAVQHA